MKMKFGPGTMLSMLGIFAILPLLGFFPLATGHGALLWHLHGFWTAYLACLFTGAFMAAGVAALLSPLFDY